MRTLSGVVTRPHALAFVVFVACGITSQAVAQTGLVPAASSATSSVPAPASVSPDPAAAKKAYDRGLAAHRKGDESSAARAFAEADAFAPSAVALQAALDAAREADDGPLGAELLDRAARRAPHASGLALAVRKASERFAGRVGRLSVDCKVPCVAQLDGEVISVPLVRWVSVGAHLVRFRSSDGAGSGSGEIVRTVNVVADVVAEATFAPAPSAAPTASVAPTPVTPVLPDTTSAPAPPPPVSAAPSAVASPAPRRGISPTVFWILTGVTSVVGIGAVASGLDTSRKHQSFEDQRCSSAPVARCGTLASEGKDAQFRTNVLLGVTGAFALATGVTGGFLVQWSKDPQSGAALSYRGAF